MTKAKEAPGAADITQPLLLDGLTAIASGLHEHCHGHDAAVDPCAFARALLGDFEALVANLSAPVGA